jgi:transcription termination factor Rho
VSVHNIKGKESYTPLRKEIIQMVRDVRGEHDLDPQSEIRNVEGFLHIVCPPHLSPYGFLRPAIGAPIFPDDIYVTPRQIRRFIPKRGDFITGEAHPPMWIKDRQGCYFALDRIETINHVRKEDYGDLSHYLKHK